MENALKIKTSKKTHSVKKPIEFAIENSSDKTIYIPMQPYSQITFDKIPVNAKILHRNANADKKGAFTALATIDKESEENSKKEFSMTPIEIKPKEKIKAVWSGKAFYEKDKYITKCDDSGAMSQFKIGEKGQSYSPTGIFKIEIGYTDSPKISQIAKWFSQSNEFTIK